jgi:hypothetical protein
MFNQSVCLSLGYRVEDKSSIPGSAISLFTTVLRPSPELTYSMNAET